MGLFSSKEENSSVSSVSIPRELLNEKIQVSVCESIPNTNIKELISAIFAEKIYMPTMRKSEEHFTTIREEVQYMLMLQALALGANAHGHTLLRSLVINTLNFGNQKMQEIIEKASVPK